MDITCVRAKVRGVIYNNFMSPETKAEEIIALFYLEPPTTASTTTPEKLSENSTKIVEKFEEKSENNGGKTGYYDLPLPDRDKIQEILIELSDEEINLLSALYKIINLCPDTLNCLIEAKNMPFWRGEILKAAYGLEGRMEKNKDPQNAEIRELNKIIYYANRRLKMLLKENAG